MHSCVSVSSSLARLRARQPDPVVSGLLSPALPAQRLHRGSGTLGLTTQFRSSNPAGGAVAPCHLSPGSRLLPASSQTRTLAAPPLLAASLLPIGRGRAGPHSKEGLWFWGLHLIPLSGPPPLWALPPHEAHGGTPTHTPVLSLDASGCHYKLLGDTQRETGCMFTSSVSSGIQSAASVWERGGWARHQVHTLWTGIQPDQHPTPRGRRRTRRVTRPSPWS